MLLRLENGKDVTANEGTMIREEMRHPDVCRMNRCQARRVVVASRHAKYTERKAAQAMAKRALTKQLTALCRARTSHGLGEEAGARAEEVLS